MVAFVVAVLLGVLGGVFFCLLIAVLGPLMMWVAGTVQDLLP